MKNTPRNISTCETIVALNPNARVSITQAQVTAMTGYTPPVSE
jgi:hypothetical protein